MLAAAAATGRSTYLYWLPCRGSMLSSIIRRSVQGPDDGDFPHACLRQMDWDVALVQPWTSELNIIAMAMLGVAWLTLVVELGWRWRTKVVAALPGVATLAVALAEPWRAATRDKPLPTCRSTVTNFVRPRWVGPGSGIVLDRFGAPSACGTREPGQVSTDLAARPTVGFMETACHRAQVTLARGREWMVVDVAACEGEHRKIVADAQMAQRLVAAWAESVPAGLLDRCQVDVYAGFPTHLLGKDVDELFGSDQVGE